MEFNLSADSMNKLHTWIDASYAIHPDMKSHTGGIMSFGIGGVLSKSTKQKINSKSSTEAELIGVSDYFPTTMWTKLFLESQGHEIKSNILEQDNQSTIKLVKNGRMSSEKQTRHINIRYFFMKDLIERDNIEVRHCPTEIMIADFFTKPLQGATFIKFRAVIMGHKHISELYNNSHPSFEERVEGTEIDETGNKATDELGEQNCDRRTKVINNIGETRPKSDRNMKMEI